MRLDRVKNLLIMVLNIDSGRFCLTIDYVCLLFNNFCHELVKFIDFISTIYLFLKRLRLLRKKRNVVNVTY